jgi:hypothetical protein
MPAAQIASAADGRSDHSTPPAHPGRPRPTSPGGLLASGSVPRPQLGTNPREQRESAHEELSAHFGAAVIPARPYKPRDKAKAEVAVQIASRWILAALRNRTFYSLEEVRVAVAELLEKLNGRKMRRIEKSRRELFEEIERAALKPLPVRPFEYAEWSQPKVDLSYHVEHDDHFYSVHFTLIDEKLDLRATETTVEILRRNTRRAIRAATRRGSTPLARSTCRALTSTRSSGRLSGSPTGQGRRGLRRRRCSRRSWPRRRTRSRASRLAWASCGRRRTTRPSA